MYARTRRLEPRADHGRWLGTVGHVLRRLRRVLDLLLHGVRRRATLAAIAARRPASLLFMCNGNIFRSPFAAAFLTRALDHGGDGGGAAVESAGLIGPGRTAAREAILAAARYGVDLRDHRSQLATADLVRAADVIVVMEPEQRRIVCQRFGRAARDVLLLGDLDPAPITSRAITDPWEQGPAVCEAVYQRIARCVEALADALRRAGSA
jgi:protein-tyrosine-phosphatase